MAASMPSLCDDLLGGDRGARRAVRPLDDAGWLTPTAAPGWTVHDQVAHLAHFDEDARIGAVDPERFAGMRAEVLADVDAFVAVRDRSGPQEDGARGAGVVARAARRPHRRGARPRPGTRVPWYGPDMTVASSITARIMETWAHGQDCFDALGVEHEPSAHAVPRGVHRRAWRCPTATAPTAVRCPTHRCASSSRPPTGRRGCSAPTTRPTGGARHRDGLLPARHATPPP